MGETSFKEVLDLIFEFILSLVALVGGGYLLYTGRQTEVVISLMSVVLTFWFSRRNTDNILNKQQKQNNQNQVSPPAPTEGGQNNGI